jgi:glucuronoarabinoxylan endo-1,4-beta-xylanase
MFTRLNSIHSQLFKWANSLKGEIMFETFFNRSAALLLLLPAIILSASVNVDFSKTYQTIDGFGGSSAWCGALSDAIMDGLYKNGSNQVGFTILRLRIDPSSSKWADEKSNATKAKTRGAMVFATPWAYPESLTTNNATIKGYINTAKFASVAAHLKSFWTYCGEGNVDIMSLENEPDYAQSITYEGCTWTAQNFLDFCKTYAPAIGKPVMLPESYHYDFKLSDPTLNDATAAANVTYVGGHLYGVSPKTYTLAIDKGKHVWETEHYLSNDDASTCMTFAKELFDCMNCSFSAYVWWWMTYDSKDGGKDGLWANNAPNHRAWVLAQFSKWVRPGFVRVDATYSPQNGVNAVAFKGSTGYVIVVMNSNTSAQNVTFACSNATISSVNKYTSTQTKSGASEGVVAVTNNSFSASLDAQSVTTFVSTDGVLVINPSKGFVNPNNSVTSKSAAGNFMYMVNGKRFNLQGTNESRSRASEIFVMPGNTYVNIGAGKSIQDSKK